MPDRLPHAVLVGHRGDAARHPENTLDAFRSAARLGLRHIELDVQLTSDREPVVIHDDTLERTHGLATRVTAARLDELRRLGVLTRGAYPPAVPQLGEFADWLDGEPGMHAFIEIKKESLRAHDRGAMIEAVRPVLSPLSGRVTVISYDAPILGMARRAGFGTGYVLPDMSARSQSIARRLAPAFLFADHRNLLRAGGPWPGNWTWVAFEVATPETASRVTALGVTWLESMNPACLLAAGWGRTC